MFENFFFFRPRSDLQKEAAKGGCEDGELDEILRCAGYFALLPEDIILHILTDYGLDASTLARLSCVSRFFQVSFRSATQNLPMSITERVAYDILKKSPRLSLFVSQPSVQGSWKRTLRRAELVSTLPTISASLSHSVFSDGHGRVYTCGGGCNWCNRPALGQGPKDEDVSLPTRVYIGPTSHSHPHSHPQTNLGTRVVMNNSSDDDHAVVMVAAGGSHTLLLTASGVAYSFGWNAHGQLALEHREEKHFPTRIPVPAPHRVCRVSAGFAHTAIITVDGTLWTAGNNSKGQLGHNDTFFRSTLEAVSFFQTEGIVQQCGRVTEVSAGGEHTLVLTDQGNVFAFGLNLCGQLGLGDQEDRIAPALIKNLVHQGHQCIGISTGTRHSAVVTLSGKLLTFGDSEHGKLGYRHAQAQFGMVFPDPRSTYFCQTLPHIVPSLSDHYITRVSAGSRHTVAITDLGTAWIFGQSTGLHIPTQGNAHTSQTHNQHTASSHPIQASLTTSSRQNSGQNSGQNSRPRSTSSGLGFGFGSGSGSGFFRSASDGSEPGSSRGNPIENDPSSSARRFSVPNLNLNLNLNLGFNLGRGDVHADGDGENNADAKPWNQLGDWIAGQLQRRLTIDGLSGLNTQIPEGRGEPNPNHNPNNHRTGPSPNHTTNHANTLNAANNNNPNNHGIFNNNRHRHDADSIWTPVPLRAFEGVFMAQGVAGYRYTVLRSEAGGMYCFGDNSDGRLGLGEKDTLVTPTQLSRFYDPLR